MANITAALVKELRERTGAGMMDCKKALTEADGDIELAIENMRVITSYSIHYTKLYEVYSLNPSSNTGAFARRSISAESSSSSLGWGCSSPSPATGRNNFV